MSIRLMTRVWDEAMDVEGTALLILLCLADYAHDDDDPRAWPSIERLCQRTRRAETTVRDALTSLAGQGYIWRENRPGRSTVYHIILPVTPTVDRTPSDSEPLGTPDPNPSGTPGGGVLPTEPISIKEPLDDPVITKSGLADEVSPGNPTDEMILRARDAGDFPLVARRMLGDITPEQAENWRAAWATTQTITTDEVFYSAETHLSQYLIGCRESGHKPSASVWVRFFITDRDRHIATLQRLADSAEQADEDEWVREGRRNRALTPTGWGQEPTT